MGEEQADTLLGTEDNPVVVKPEHPYEKPRVLVEWQAHARIFKKRSPIWFLSFLILTLGLLVVLALLQQWTLMLVVGAFSFVLYVFNTVEPEEKTYLITTLGVKVGERTTRFEDLKWFWFDEDSDDVSLYVATYLNFPHLLEIPLPSGDGKKVREEIENHLLKYIPFHEEKYRDVYKLIDRVVNKMTPWLPKSLVDWYGNSFHAKDA